MALLGAEVYSIERYKTLLLKAEKILKQININVNLFLGDGSLGIPAHAPYDKILVTVVSSSIPQKLIEQLMVGGSMVIPIGGKTIQVMKKVTKISEHRTEIQDYQKFRFVPLIGKLGWSES